MHNPFTTAQLFHAYVATVEIYIGYSKMYLLSVQIGTFFMKIPNSARNTDDRYEWRLWKEDKIEIVEESNTVEREENLEEKKDNVKTASNMEKEIKKTMRNAMQRGIEGKGKLRLVLLLI